MSPTQSSGMNLNVYKVDTDQYEPFGELKPCSGEDGSLSLYSNYFNEGFHSRIGALTEAKEKFIHPVLLNQIKEKSEFNVLDLCFGLGYNTACLLEELKNSPIKINWWGLEQDRRPIRLALDSKSFKENWTRDVLDVLNAINSKGIWENAYSKGMMLWGDAREKINFIPKGIHFDLIMHDAFSPNHCPQLWSEELLHLISNRLSNRGLFVTYCRAAAVRRSLQRAGLDLLSIKLDQTRKQSWSDGTIAMKTGNLNNFFLKGTKLQPLSLMEQEHLNTAAGIPYRDLTGKDTKEVIHLRRRQEQQLSKLESTSAWHKRWTKVQ